jgi:hypothetical protein
VPSLVLGPLLRYVDETEAVFWMETDEPCEIEVLGSTERTFCVSGHHYALLRATGLEAGAWHEYDVVVDGRRVWPLADSPFPPSCFHTYPKEGPLRLAFGSCRVSAPHEPPWTLTGDEHPRGFEVDALYALARRMMEQPHDEWPNLLLMLGDQVYADEVSIETRAFIESRRDVSRHPGDCVIDFEEYTRLYREAWSDPTIRWLLSTVSTAMVWDDHDVHDDWNISRTWLEEMRSHEWWDEHIIDAICTYWLYQHLGNLAPEAHRDDELLGRVRDSDDGEEALREFARRADRETGGSRWSYCRDLGGARLVVIDSRAGRVLDPGRRSMVDEEEWDWITEHATGGHDHLLIGTSLPWVLAPGMHHAEAFSEALSEGAWGDRLARTGERIREALDLEHWAAFQRSFARMAELQRSVAAGERGPAPASIVTLSGDVHHAYLCEVGFRRGSGARSSAWQAVCSPFRNPLDAGQRRKVRIASSRSGTALGRALARLAGVGDPDIRWRIVDDGPWFDNVVGTIQIDGRRLDIVIEKALPGPRLEAVLRRRLA